MKVPLLDLKAQYELIKDEIGDAVAEVFQSQHFILGPKVKDLEEAIASYCGCEHAVGVSSGTDALLIVLTAEDIGPGDEVITTPYTFFATVGSIARLGATPVFVDIDPATYNMDPRLVEAAITANTKAIIPVHLYGQCADMDPILMIMRKYNITVVEDAAQAIGAEYKERRAGSMGNYGTFSFFPSKNLGAAGDGGMVVTNDPDRAKKLAILRVHGGGPKYQHQVVGGNFRLDPLQAAVLGVKLRHLEAWHQGRQSNARRYNELFGATGLLKKGRIVLPTISANRHIFNQYVIRVRAKDTGRGRDDLRTFLRARKVGHEVYYPIPLHLQECFKYLGYKAGDFPHSELAANETIALPIFPELTDEQAKYVVDCVAEFVS